MAGHSEEVSCCIYLIDSLNDAIADVIPLNINDHWSSWFFFNLIEYSPIKVRVLHCFLFFG